MKYLVLLTLLLSCASTSKKGMKWVQEEVDYATETTKLKGYIAYKNDKKKKPAVIIVHEWWGHTQYVRERAEQLSKMGYTAFALDMYGDGKKADHPNDAKAFMMQTMKNMPEAEARIKKAYELVKNHPQVDSSKMAMIGYCFGGAVVLKAVAMDLDLKAAVSFHGSLANAGPFPKGSKTKLLVLNGAKDPMVTKEHINNLKTAAKKASLDYTFINYPNAVHAFTNPEATDKGKKFKLPLAYDKDADQESWEEMRKLFNEVL